MPRRGTQPQPGEWVMISPKPIVVAPFPLPAGWLRSVVLTLEEQNHLEYRVSDSVVQEGPRNRISNKSPSHVEAAGPGNPWVRPMKW